MAPSFLPGHLGEWWWNSQSLDMLITIRSILQLIVTMGWFMGSIPERRKLDLSLEDLHGIPSYEVACQSSI